MTTRIILAAVGAIVALAGWMWRRSALAQWQAAGENAKKKKPRLPTVVMLLGIWLAP